VLTLTSVPCTPTPQRALLQGNTLHVQETSHGTHFNLGVNQAITIDLRSRAMTGVSDPRKGGSPAAAAPFTQPPAQGVFAPPPAAKAGRRAMLRTRKLV